MGAGLEVPLPRALQPKGMFRREAKPKDEETAAPELTMLPPRDKRLYSGNMAKKVITTNGTQWQVLICVGVLQRPVKWCLCTLMWVLTCLPPTPDAILRSDGGASCVLQGV